MNSSCLHFAFQSSVTDFKSPSEASARAVAGAQSSKRAEPGVQGGSRQELEQREMLGITELRKWRCKTGDKMPEASWSCSERDSTALIYTKKPKMRWWECLFPSPPPGR